MAVINLHNLENGIASVLTAGTSFSGSFNIYTQMANGQKDCPYMVVKVREAQKDFDADAWRCITDVEVNQIAADTSASIASYNIDTAYETILAQGIDFGNYTTGITIVAVFLKATSREIENDVWRQTLTMEIVATG